MSHLHFHLQVAFASDFTSEWKAKQLGPSFHTDDSIDSLVGLTFKGIQMAFRDPLYKVRMDFSAYHLAIEIYVWCNILRIMPFIIIMGAHLLL